LKTRFERYAADSCISRLATTSVFTTVNCVEGRRLLDSEFARLRHVISEHFLTWSLSGVAADCPHCAEESYVIEHRKSRRLAYVDPDGEFHFRHCPKAPPLKVLLTTDEI
jgi:hypothetical protein